MNDETLEQIIIRSLQEGVITIECNGVVSGINPAALRILGLNRDALLGFSVEDTLPKRNANSAFLDIFRNLIDKDEVTFLKEVELIRSDGQKIGLSVSSAVLDVTECAPGMESYVVVFRDITAFKNLERAKRKAADHLSHELKTPLSILKACLQSLSEIYGIDPKAHRILERGERNLDRLLAIQDSVEQIFFPQKPQPKILPIEITINNILDRILQSAKHRHVELERKFDYSGFIIFDYNILETILNVLVKNAIENTPGEGIVIVNFNQIDSAHFQIEVKDHGVGIPLEDLDFIFEGFHHTQDTNEYSTKKPFDFNAGGKGLELFQLRNMSDLFGFKIDVESQRCKFIPQSTDHCPGDINVCRHIRSAEECFKSGHSVFRFTFRNMSE